MSSTKTFYIDGCNFSNLEEFYEEISTALIPGVDWGKNLDAFDDILRGGFGTPDEGFTLIWKNSQRSRELLGHMETERQLKIRLSKCHPDSVSDVKNKIADAQIGLGSTVFDWLVDIIHVHCEGGAESKDGVALLLE